MRENILFSHEYDETFYNLVLDGEPLHTLIKARRLTVGLVACALGPDLALLPQGDLTEVGEKGITVSNSLVHLVVCLPLTLYQLSGGQRARIALARAVYARADL